MEPASQPATGPAIPLPEDFMRMMQSWREPRVVLTALELDVFTAVGGGASAAAVARQLGTDPRGTGFLLHALAALGLLEKRGATFHNAPLAARHLCAGAPHDWRAALFHTAALWHRWSHLTECVRTGRPAPRGADEEAGTVAFIAAMHQNAATRAPQFVAALDLTGVRRALDVGGGSGAYSIALARAVPGLCVEVLDLPDVVPLAARYAAEAGLSDRVTTRVGDLRADDLGRGYDLVLLSAVCHMLGPGENADLIRRAAAALAPGGRVVVHDYILAPDRTAPAVGALFALNMLVNTPAGGNYTEAEYSGWMREAGLGDLRHGVLPGPTGLVIGTRR
jgi:predicted O-methyltransferase YrrM